MPKIKCVVWDLDNTIWNGTISEGDQVSLYKNAKNAIEIFDKRGILQVIASKNQENECLEKLREFGIEKYFVAWEINWNAKSHSIKKMQKLLNIGIDTFAFIDDSIFEREEVQFSLPLVRIYDSKNIENIIDFDEFIPDIITEDTTRRREMYLEDKKRKEIEDTFCGTSEEFLKSLKIVLTIRKANKNDLDRVIELTTRTNQLNTTGCIYSYKELVHMLNDKKYTVLVAEMSDKFGSYGKIGVAVVEKVQNINIIKLFLISCRVMSKGAGSAFIQYIINFSLKNKLKIHVEFTETERNRFMYITYRFMNFKEIIRKGKNIVLEYEGNMILPYRIEVN